MTNLGGLRDTYLSRRRTALTFLEDGITCHSSTKVQDRLCASIRWQYTPQQKCLKTAWIVIDVWMETPIPRACPHRYQWNAIFNSTRSKAWNNPLATLSNFQKPLNCQFFFGEIPPVLFFLTNVPASARHSCPLDDLVKTNLNPLFQSFVENSRWKVIRFGECEILAFHHGPI